MCILQPDAWHSFTASDPDHPMLPPGPDLLTLTELPVAAAVAAPLAAADTASTPGATALAVVPAARNVTEAVWELMDCPHPLETLADPGAYLASGSISRYHNPEHYTKALGRIIHLKRQAERRPDRVRAALPALTSEDAAAAAELRSADTGSLAVPWDSSDCLDLDLRLAPAFLAADAHTYR